MAPTKVISADDHMDLHTLPLDLWQSRLPAELRDRGPRVEETERGQFWVCEGDTWGRAQPHSIRGLPSVFDRAGISEWITRPSTPEDRLEDMERDGIQASVIYPGPGGFPVKDPILKYHCLKAYNDWTSEFNSQAQGRLSNLAVLPSHDGQAAADELSRAATMGHRGAVIDHFSMPTPMYDPGWDPLWDAAEDTGLSISVHLGGGTYMLPRAIGSWVMSARTSVVSMQLDEVLAVVCFSGILEKHPKLKIVLGESGLGWVPYVLERMDQKYLDFATNTRDYRGEIKPSDLFHRQVYATFEDEKLGIEMIPLIGAGNVMWACDYPHPVSTWPNSMEHIDKVLKGLSQQDRDLIIRGNAAKLYRFS